MAIWTHPYDLDDPRDCPVERSLTIPFLVTITLTLVVALAIIALMIDYFV